MAQTDHLYMPEDHMEALYTSSNPLVRYVFTQRLSAIAQRMPGDKAVAVLDAGCGEGHLVEVLHARNPNAVLTGADVTEVALKEARKRCPYASFVHADISKLPFEDNSFDLVVTTEVLEHIYEYQDVLREFVRITKPGGSVIITFPHESLWTVGRFFLGRRPVKVPDHVNAFSPRSMSKAIRLEKVHQESLPCKYLPFFLSLGCLLEYRK